MEPEGSLPHSKVPAKSPYPEPDQSSPCTNFLNILLNIILPSTPGSSKWYIFLSFPTKTLYTPPLWRIRATCPAHLILLDFITRTVLNEEYGSLSFSLGSFLHSPITSPHLDPNFLLNTLFSNILSLRSFLSVNDHVSHSHKTTGKIVELYICIFTGREKILHRMITSISGLQSATKYANW